MDLKVTVLNTVIKKDKRREMMNINEKFKKMWEEFKEKYGAQSIVLEGKLQNLEDKMNWFEQKYFKPLMKGGK